MDTENIILDTPEKENEYANRHIASYTVQQENELADLFLKVKETKRAIRKLKKQAECQHDFKLKLVFNTDQYKCKKCKYEFIITHSVMKVQKNTVVESKYNDLYSISEDDAPQAMENLYAKL